MSSVVEVPELPEHLRTGSAWHVLREAGTRRVLTDAGRRLRAADGFSHARSLAFVGSLLAIQGIVALVGLASAFGRTGSGDLMRQLVQGTAPASAGRELTDAVDQARANGRSGSYWALGAGVVGSLVTATTGMGQVQRGLNRLYGLERDRPSRQKYVRAAVLAATAGTVIVVAFVSILYAGAIGDSLGDHALTPVWGVARVPLGLVCVAVGIAAMFRWCPNRRQPGWSWLWPGAALAVLLWTLATVTFTAVLRIVPTLGDAYGPLAGIVALMLWSALSSIAFLYGAAVAAQLEAASAEVKVVELPTLGVELVELDPARPDTRQPA